MIVVEKWRELTLPVAEAGNVLYADERYSGHLSAASGMVIVGTQLYVVADDELHLGLFSLLDKEPGQCLKVFAGELPSKKKARKKHKPDLETLTLLPAMPDFPEGALLALGSGSKPNRQRAILLPLDKNGHPEENIITLDLSPLYTELREYFPDLNIEGALISHHRLVLMQRGNQAQPQSALIYCPLDLFMQLVNGHAVNFSGRLTVKLYSLPKVEGVPLCFTDGALLANGDILFSAVAEGTDDSYNDGVCVGAALGIISADGSLACCELLQHPHKVEGVAIASNSKGLQVLLVTDADDAAIPAALLAVINADVLFTASSFFAPTR